MDEDKLYDLIKNIPVTFENEDLIEEIKEDIARKKLYCGITEGRKTTTKKRKSGGTTRENRKCDKKSGTRTARGKA